MSAKTRKTPDKKKTGKDFETVLEAVFEGYKTRGMAKIEKVDPPVRVVGSAKFRKVIFLENPWLDYAGTWTEHGGRTLIIEAKSTMEPRLELGVGGITDKQIENLVDWHRFGAATAIVWHHLGDVKVITGATIAAALSMGTKSFKWRQLPATRKGLGWVIWDVLDAIAERA